MTVQILKVKKIQIYVLQTFIFPLADQLPSRT